MTIDERKIEVAALRNQRDTINSALAAAEGNLAAAMANEMGVHIGSVVYTEQMQGFSPNKRLVRRRYRVTKIYFDYNRVKLWGRTIRKDGTDGDNHELYSDWKLEASVD